MKFSQAVIIVTDEDTGKPYARQLSAWEINLELSQLQALDGGALKAVEVAPFILRGASVSEERAQRILQKQNSLHLGAREGVEALIGRRVTVALNLPGRQAGGKGSRVQQLPKPQPAKACEHETIIAGRCITCDKVVRRR